ncbi:MAG TPA: hypothetical protein VI365_34515 [Trebonia sp.]
MRGNASPTPATTRNLHRRCAARWLATAYLLPETAKTSWGQVDAADVRRWMARLLDRCSDAHAYQYRALQQFFGWQDRQARVWQRPITASTRTPASHLTARHQHKAKADSRTRKYPPLCAAPAHSAFLSSRAHNSMICA